ncbi:hypothetical protein L611_004500000230 [Aminobacter sp. J15]|nr:hypothetical protein L611_004500000230 [Aminobacter sp. J15]
MSIPPFSILFGTPSPFRSHVVRPLIRAHAEKRRSKAIRYRSATASTAAKFVRTGRGSAAFAAIPKSHRRSRVGNRLYKLRWDDDLRSSYERPDRAMSGWERGKECAVVASRLVERQRDHPPRARACGNWWHRSSLSRYRCPPRPMEQAFCLAGDRAARGGFTQGKLVQPSGSRSDNGQRPGSAGEALLQRHVRR